MTLYRKLPRALRYTLLLVPVAALAVTAFALSPVGDPDSGSWQLSQVNDCQEGLICVEWEYSVGGVIVKDSPCCITPDKLGSTSWSACDTYFRHEH